MEAASARLFDLETLGGAECPHCGATGEAAGEKVEACPWTATRSGLDVLPWPEHCLNRPDPKTMPIPF